MLLLDQTGTLLPVAPEDDTAAAAVLGHIAEHHGAAALTTAEAQVTALGGAPGSPFAFTGDRGGSLHVWSLSDRHKAPRSRRVHEQPVRAATCLQIAADGPTLVFSAALDGSVRLWETNPRKPVPRHP
jgi:WD40 repeat protein